MIHVPRLDPQPTESEVEWLKVHYPEEMNSPSAITMILLAQRRLKWWPVKQAGPLGREWAGRQVVMARWIDHFLLVVKARRNGEPEPDLEDPH